MMFRVGATNFAPRIQVFGPTSALVGIANSSSGFTRDVVLALQATNAGFYTVAISSTVAGATGTYGLHAAQLPQTFATSSEDEGGDLANGIAQKGKIELGDLDLWRFTAAAGDSLMLRMGATAFPPWIRLYGPNGALVAEAISGSGFTRDVVMTLQATNAGAYTAVVSSTTSGGVGDYTLHLADLPQSLATSPGDEGGDLTNGIAQKGKIELGDLDLWRFTAAAGDSLMLRMGATAFPPWIRLYGPTGGLVSEAISGSGFTRDVVMTLQATNAGAYTAVVSSTTSGGVGDYSLHLAQPPRPFTVSEGDEGGTLTNGVSHLGSIDVGDLDLWTLSVGAGEGLMLRVGTTAFPPWIRLYGPDGALVEEAISGSGFTRDVVMALQATNAGAYTAVVSSTTSGGAGDYALHLARAPGVFVVATDDGGGALSNGVAHFGTLTVGDLDLWSFFGTVGDSNVLQITTTNFAPWVRVYGPTGALVDQFVSGSGFTRTARLSQMITNTGPFTAVVSATVSGQVGTYTVRQSRVPPDLRVPPDTTIEEGGELSVTISAQDPEIPAKPLAFALVTAPLGLTLAATGSTNATLSWRTTETDGPSTNFVVVTVTDIVNRQTFVRSNRFEVVVQEINTPPQLTVPADLVMDEQMTLAVSAVGTDTDLPANALTYALDAPPEGMRIDPVTGAITWTPTELQGPSTNLITVVVTDDNPSAANATRLSTTNRFTVVVREVNRPPQALGPGRLLTDELVPWTDVILGTDPDLPTNTLFYSLRSAPTGMTIDRLTGALSWLPTEGQAPSTNLVVVTVEDNGLPSLLITNTVTLVVNEVNEPPTLPTQADRSIAELTSLIVTNAAIDTDFPANLLTYTLLNAPSNALISASGVITWTPNEAQGPSTNVFTTVVTDDGVPGRSATNRFIVVVHEANQPPVWSTPTDRAISENAVLMVTNSATDADLPANTLTYALLSAPSNAVISADGIITWRPSEADGPSTNHIVAVVSDDANPPSRATNSFTVVVQEVNEPPALETIADQSVHFGAPLVMQLRATDPDLPANHLTYSLDVGPTNAVLKADSGLLSWTPSEDQIGVFRLTVRVADDGSPALEATRTFQVTVTGNGSALDLERLGSGLMQLTINGDTGYDYELQTSSDLATWNRLIQFRLSTSPYPYIDPTPAADGLRFYRLLLLP